MKVAVYYNNKDVRIEDRPKPKAGPGEILFKVRASGICGSDVMEWYRIKKAPRVLGHEAAGVIEQVGEGVAGYKPGDRVFVSHHVPCNSCRYCLNGHHTACETLHTTNFHPGGFSEFVRVPKINVERGVYRLPDSVSFEEAAMIEPLACVLRGQRLARLKRGQTVLVLGSGVSGQLHIRLAKSKGARVIATDVNDYRLDFAKKSGADLAINAKENVPEKVRDFNGSLADLVILCTGAPQALKQALDSADRGGTILFFAVPSPDVETPIPLVPLWRNEMTLLTSYGAAPGDLKESLDLISSGKVKVKDLVTHKLPLEKAQEGFKLVADAGDSMKVVLEP